MKFNLIKTLVYKIKNKLFRITKEASKLKRPTYQELVKYEFFQRSKNNKFILSFGSGRSGQNWLSKIFNSHPNWIGTGERFADFEAFYRYITYYNLPIDKEGFMMYMRNYIGEDLNNLENTMLLHLYNNFNDLGIKEDINKLLSDKTINCAFYCTY